MQKDTSLTATIGSGTFWYAMSSVLLKAVRLISVLLILRYLSVYEYSIIELVSSTPALLGFLLLPGVSNVVIADMGVEKSQGNLSKMRTIFSNYFKIQAIAALVLWAILFFGSEIIMKYYGDNTAGNLVKIFSLSVLISPFRSMVITLFEVYFKFFLRSLYNFLEEFFKFLIIIVAFFMVHLRAEGVIIAIVLSQILVLLVLFIPYVRLYRKFSKARIVEHPPFWSLLYGHGKWAIFSSYLNTFGQNIRLWIIKFMLGTEAVGIFAAASGLLQNTLSLFPLGTVLTSIIPQYVDDKERFYRIINKSIKYHIISFLVIGIGAYVVFPPLVTWLFPKYVASLTLFKIMLLALIPLVLPSVFTPVFYAIKAQKDLFYAIVLKTFIIIALAPLFIWAFGFKGIAIEYIVTALLFVLERVRVIKKLLPGYKMRIRGFFTYDEYDAIIIRKALVFLKLRKTV